jgi:hypothetical protein
LKRENPTVQALEKKSLRPCVLFNGESSDSLPDYLSLFGGRKRANRVLSNDMPKDLNSMDPERPPQRIITRTFLNKKEKGSLGRGNTKKRIIDHRICAYMHTYSLENMQMYITPTISHVLRLPSHLGCDKKIYYLFFVCGFIAFIIIA